MSRLPEQPGERIDRSRPIAFTFDGRRIEGYEGDTIVSALYASGRRVFSRSFKYHRPRGELCACGQCANSLFQVQDAPGIRGCGEPARDGMVVTHQNAWPSLGFDVMRITDRVGGPFTPVGFYYKTFIRPRRLWPLYERLLRKAAGLGRLPARREAREWVTEYRRRRCDVLVVGGGVAGLEAAIGAARDGADVVLCDEDAALGGVSASSDPGRVAELVAQAAQAGVEVLTRAPALGFYDGLVAIWQGDTLHQVRADRHVLATGALQQPLVFAGNDLPGVMLSGGARRLAALYAVAPGRRAVVATVDDRGVDDALALHAAGVEIAAIADLRERIGAEGLATRVEASGIAYLPRTTVVRATGSDGVSGAVLSAVDAAGRAIGAARRMPCDLLAVAGPAAPAISLLLQAGGRAAYDEATAAFAVEHVPDGIAVVGAAAGEGLGATATPPAHATDGDGGKAFVDLDEDVTVKDVEHAIAEGYDSLELSKRYTTVTMGPSQGRFSQLASARVIAARTGLDLGTVGLTTARPPWSTVPMAAFAGRPFEAARRSPIHAAHRELGANVKWAGDWRRPYDYGDPAAETAAVHDAAGLIDVSTLGKLLVRGPGAGELLDRIYPSPISTLAVGRIRYGLMTSESGRITDDGTVVRLDEETFYVTTTTGGLAGVESQLTWWLEVWRLDATVTDVTQGLGAVNLAGPRTREILADLTDLDLSTEAFPYLHARRAKVAGVECVLMRIGFVGELGYEIHCSAVHARHLWDALIDAGAPHGIRPFGLESQRVLRLQKAHVIVGHDTDSEMTPYGARMEWAVDFDKPQAFIGRWALEQAAGHVPRELLVGFSTAGGELPTEGAAVVVDGVAAGQVTSARRSARLDKTIGLATVPPALAIEGSRITISDDGRRIEAVVTTRPFYDPDGKAVRS